MIVAPAFPGDKNKAIMNIQHDLYDENLCYMVFNAQSIYKNALEILELNNELILSSIDFKGFDHRVFQVTHDIVAAYFRFQFSNQLEQTLFETEQEYKIRLIDIWSKFWKDEISELSKNPYWIRNIIYAAVWENKEKGYEAEKKLKSILKSKYSNFKEYEWLNI
ncbi:MAG: hypothetical protein WCE54_04690 [Ignavibacteriaceae bacterium]